jgi:hypothetical protein
MKLQEVFYGTCQESGISLKDGLRALYDSFLEEVPFPIQLGPFLLRLDRPLALERLAAVTAGRAKVAA